MGILSKIFKKHKSEQAEEYTSIIQEYPEDEKIFMSIDDIPLTTSEKEPTLSSQKRSNSALEDIKGFYPKYFYERVEVCVWNHEIPPKTTVDNRIVFVQEKDNASDPNAVLLLLVPQKRKLGYLYRGRMQDMVNDFLDRGDKVTGRICELSTPPYAEVKIDIVFYKRRQVR